MHPKQLYKENYSPEKASLKLKEALTRIDELEAKVSNLENQFFSKEATICKLSSVLDKETLQRKPTLFKYLCGLTVDQFNLLWKCIEPYVSLIVYDESASDNKVNAHLMDQKSELLTVLTCCQHGLDLGISGWSLASANLRCQDFILLGLCSWPLCSIALTSNLPQAFFNL